MSSQSTEVKYKHLDFETHVFKHDPCLAGSTSFTWNQDRLWSNSITNQVQEINVELTQDQCETLS